MRLGFFLPPLFSQSSTSLPLYISASPPLRLSISLMLTDARQEYINTELLLEWIPANTTAGLVETPSLGKRFWAISSSRNGRNLTRLVGTISRTREQRLWNTKDV